MRMMTYVLAVAIIGLGCNSATSTEKTGAGKTATTSSAKWLTDFEQAKQVAAEKKLPIFADFSGSDWCGWCIKLDEEVLSTAPFKDYAKDNLVLFVADFPAKKEQTDALKTQNRALADKYSVAGFPTVLLLDATGKVLAQTGYRRGGPEKYVEYLKEVLKSGGNG